MTCDLAGSGLVASFFIVEKAIVPMYCLKVALLAYLMQSVAAGMNLVTM